MSGKAAEVSDRSKRLKDCTCMKQSISERIDGKRSQYLRNGPGMLKVKWVSGCHYFVRCRMIE